MTMSKWFIMSLVLVFSLVAGSISCGEQPSPATALRSPSEPTTVSVVTGEVLVMKAGATTWSKVSPGMALGLGDRIKTGVGSNATITFFEGSTIELAADTEISVSDLGVAERTGSTVIKVRQQIGKTTSRVTKMTDPASRYEIETPDGAALVRGSVGDVIVTEGNSTTIINREGRWFAVIDGREIPIPQGYELTFTRGQRIVPVPVPVPPPPILPPPLPQPLPSLPPLEILQPPADWQTWTQTTVNDFMAGIRYRVKVIDVGGGDGTVILASEVERKAYFRRGTLESRSYDCGGIVEFGAISWDARVPINTELKFQIATNNDKATWNFVGPSGSPASYYGTSDTDIWAGHDGNRYIRYKAYFRTTHPAHTPALEEIRITYR